MIANSQLRETNRRFLEEHILVDQDWLAGCVKWFLDETPQIYIENLYKKAMEQWLLSDLAESGAKCLPEMAQNNIKEFELNGNYALQMQYLIDIAESAYDQLRNLHNQKLDEPDEEPEQQCRLNVSKKKRMLKLELTDGRAFIVAMECRPISCLNTKLFPGTKILLKGPIRCVNKILFLEPENVKILGGEVDTILVENAFENILLKALGRPISLTPKMDYQESVVVQQQSKNKSNVAITPSMPVVLHNPSTSTNVMHDDGDDELFSHLDISFINGNGNGILSRNTNVATSSSTTPIDKFLDDSDDDIFFEANIPDPVTVHKELRNQVPQNYIVIDDDNDCIDMTEIETEIQMEIRNMEQRTTMNNNVEQPATRFVKDNFDFYDSELDAPYPSQYSIDDDYEIFPNNITSVDITNDNISNGYTTKDNLINGTLSIGNPSKDLTNGNLGYVNLTNGNITDSNYEFKILGHPLVTIAELFTIDDNEKSEKSFIVKCEISRNAENKIDIKANQYLVTAYLEDTFNNQLEVKISNDIIANWADTSAEEIQKMRSMIGHRPQQRDKVDGVMKRIFNQLNNFDDFMKVEYLHKNDVPEVTKIIETQANLEEVLRKKLLKHV